MFERCLAAAGAGKSSRRQQKLSKNVVLSRISDDDVRQFFSVVLDLARSFRGSECFPPGGDFFHNIRFTTTTTTTRTTTTPSEAWCFPAREEVIFSKLFYCEYPQATEAV